jgi:hypothetical protein
LRSLFIPATVSKLSGLAWTNSEIRSVAVDPGNRFFMMSRDFLIDFERTALVRYFGIQSTVQIPSHIERIGPGCFSGCANLSSVVFERNAAVSVFGKTPSWIVRH